jgi:sigma-B regulation protein RsbU (phosphoserine phosphatase)
MSEVNIQDRRTERFDLRTLYETSQLLSSSLDLSFVLGNLVLTAMSKLFVTRAAAWLHDPITASYAAHAVRGISGLKEGDRISVPGISLTELVRGDDMPEELKEYGIELLAPVSFGDREIGLLSVGPKATREEFTDSELEFVRSLVNISSAAVHNSIIVEELRQANRDLDGKIQQLNTLFDISQEFNATVDRDRLVRLLSLALMGQMLVQKHAFLLRRSQEGQENGQEDAVEVVSVKGITEDELQADVVERLCAVQELVLADPDDESTSYLRDMGLALALPIRHKGETCGMLCLGPKMTGKPYQQDEIEFLFALANLAFVSIQNSYLVEEQIEKERLEEEMRLARGIQEKLQPDTMPVMDGLELAMLALASHYVAGDYTDLVQLDDHRILLAIGDVTGHGVPASLLMSNLQACLHTMVPMEITLEDVAGHINRVICRNTGFDRFITYFHGIYDSTAGSFEYVNAGHNPPMLFRSDGECELLETGGLLLGVMKDLGYERGHTTMSAGDVLVMFTDGVTESMDPAC